MSKNHPFLGGSLATWLLESVGGIRPLSPGYATIAYQPAPAVVRNLTEATISMPTVRGVAAMTWKREQDGFLFDVTVPGNSRSRIFMPVLRGDTATTTIREGDTVIWNSGRFIPDVTGITSVTTEAACIIIETGAGHYLFRSHCETE